jgi:hypothetical protein
VLCIDYTRYLPMLYLHQHKRLVLPCRCSYRITTCSFRFVATCAVLSCCGRLCFFIYRNAFVLLLHPPTSLRCSTCFLKPRYNAYGTRSFADQLVLEAMDPSSSMENPCHHRLPPSQSSSFALSSYPQLGARLSDLGQQQQGTVSSLPKTERQPQPQQQPLSFLGRSDLAAMDSAASAKQEEEECQTLRPFFDDEWPRARASSWPGIPGENASFPSATAQLSMSMSTPIACSEFPVAWSAPRRRSNG